MPPMVRPASGESMEALLEFLCVLGGNGRFPRYGLQLAVDGDTQGLEGLRGGVVGTVPAFDLFHDPCQLQCVLNWSRHHDHMASLSAMVSAGGRVFYSHQSLVQPAEVHALAHLCNARLGAGSAAVVYIDPPAETRFGKTRSRLTKRAREARGGDGERGRGGERERGRWRNDR